jgi:molybdenum cofactor biosynthesis enzyme MoaA
MLATRARMQPVFTSNQVLGRTRVIGCTAVEITQRCNLDCTLCYLSENSESVRDPPFEEIIARIDAVRAAYGPRTNVQITGGDPTLRKHHELAAFVRHARDIGLYPALFTNGIAASRKLLTELAAAGLTEVAFHVDTTQRRDGVSAESDLHAVRKEYIDRARGLGLMVVFNTTVHGGNLAELPELVRFFVAHSDVVGFASFQLQADTGRGEWDKRAAVVSLETARAQIDRGVGRPLPWDAVRIGHPKCHSYAPTLVVHDSVYPVIDDPTLFARFLRDFAHLGQDRRAPKRELIGAFVLAALAKPRWFWIGARFAARHLWAARRDLWRARGKVRKLSFFVQNFMDGDALDPERVSACSFMIMTGEGPVSMCEHNARRDDFILKPIRFFRRDGTTGEYVPMQQPARLHGS